MNVCVVESGRGQPAAQVNDLRMRVGQWFDLRRCANADDLIAANRNCLNQRSLISARPNSPIDQCEVGGFEEGFPGLYEVYEDQALYAKLCLAANNTDD